MSIIEFNNVSKVYDNRTIWGVHSLNFQIDRGQIFSIMGPSGSGKSTTLNILSNLTKPDEGSVKKASDYVIAHLTDQSKLDDEKSVLENIILKITKEMEEAQAITLARQALSDLDLTNEIDKKPRELSSGQYQRVLLACCLANSPDILLFDEPFGNIDEELKFEILDIILPVIKEKVLTIIWVTHHLKEAFQFSDRMMILNYGKIQQIGTPKEIYFSPKNMFVSNFIGIKNIYLCTSIEGKKGYLEIKSKVFNGSIKTPTENFDHTKDSLLIIRPEGVVLNERSDTKAKLIEMRFSGSFNFCIFELESTEKITAHISSYLNLEIGNSYGININTQYISIINQI